MFTGMYYHLYANFFEVFIRMPFYFSLLSSPSEALIATFYITELLLYPFNTAFKRVVCQVRHLQLSTNLYPV